MQIKFMNPKLLADFTDHIYRFTRRIHIYSTKEHVKSCLFISILLIVSGNYGRVNINVSFSSINLDEPYEVQNSYNLL